MSDETTVDLGGTPSWYEEIFPAGPCDGFFQKMGQHSVVYIDRSSDQLVVTFDNLAEAGNKRFDREPWAGKFCRDNGWNHLSVFSQGPTWFRDQKLIDFLQQLKDQGLFADHKSVAWAGTSMGGFGALAFADLAPGSTVIAFSPQTTLDDGAVPWENRFQKGKAQDWTLPRSDAAQTLDGVGKVYAIYDPVLKEDRKHIDRLPQNSLVHLKGIGLGHKSALLLRRMEQLKPVMAAAINGTLTPQTFRTMIDGRKSLYLYRKNVEGILLAQGRTTLASQFTAAFRRRRRAESTAAAAAAADAGDPGPAAAAAFDHAASTTTAALAQSAPGLRATEPGNVWMAERTDDGHLKYLSDRWNGRPFGFEERENITLPQAPDVALGFVGFGHGVGVERKMLSRYNWHVLDPKLSPPDR
ncbi:MAG: hypothetical protein AAF386_10050 [Pseudomonadota bacterium]